MHSPNSAFVECFLGSNEWYLEETVRLLSLCATRKTCFAPLLVPKWQFLDKFQLNVCYTMSHITPGNIWSEEGYFLG